MRVDLASSSETQLTKLARNQDSKTAANAIKHSDKACLTRHANEAAMRAQLVGSRKGSRKVGSRKPVGAHGQDSKVPDLSHR